VVDTFEFNRVTAVSVEDTGVSVIEGNGNAAVTAGNESLVVAGGLLTVVDGLDDMGGGLRIGLGDSTTMVSADEPRLAEDPPGLMEGIVVGGICGVVGGICGVGDASDVVVVVELPPGSLVTDADTISRRPSMFDAVVEGMTEEGVLASGVVCVTGVVTVRTMLTVLVVWD
jgi:hypothetical protein